MRSKEKVYFNMKLLNENEIDSQTRYGKGTLIFQINNYFVIY